jgi:hypothetical protein
MCPFRIRKLPELSKLPRRNSLTLTLVLLIRPLSASGLLKRVTEQETERRGRKRSFWTELVTDGHGRTSSDLDSHDDSKEFKFAFGFDSEPE